MANLEDVRLYIVAMQMAAGDAPLAPSEVAITEISPASINEFLLQGQPIAVRLLYRPLNMNEVLLRDVMIDIYRRSEIENVCFMVINIA